MCLQCWTKMSYYVGIKDLSDVTMQGISSPHIYYNFLMMKWVEPNNVL
jgi:hypothetical protein